MNDRSWFLQVGGGISVIVDTLVCAGLHPCTIYVSPKKVNFLHLVLQLVIVLTYIALSSCLKQSCKCLVMMTVINLLSHNHYIMCNDITFFICPKHWSSLHWKTLPATVAPHDSVPKSDKFLY